MGLPTGEMQVAVISTLRGDTSLQTLLGATGSPWGIFDADGVPTNQPFPYVVISMIMARLGTAFAMDYDATDVWIQASVFTQAGGFKIARGIAKQIDRDVQQSSLALANGFTNFGTLRELYQEITEADGLTQHIAIRYRAWIIG